MAVMCDIPGQKGAPWVRLTVKQARAVSALLDGESITEASQSAGLRSRSTLYRWLRKPWFVAALHKVREERQRPFVELKKLLDNSETEPHIRVRAAEDLRDMVREPDRDLYSFGSHDLRVARSILAILP